MPIAWWHCDISARVRVRVRMLDQTHNPDRAATEARKSGSMKMGSFLVMVEIELIKKHFLSC